MINDQEEQAAENVSAADNQPGGENNASTELKALPALLAYQKSYATSLGNNDAKAIKLFKEFESQEKIRRVKSELLAITQGRVADALCIQILGAGRRSRFGSFANWAKYALGFVNSAAR